MAKHSNPEIIEELRHIAKKRSGMLTPEDVVEEARHKTSPLHKQFCWDDDKAAHQFRLLQARTMIQACVKYVELNGNRTPIRVFVSLTPDRNSDIGGYREMIAVLSDKTMRQQLLSDAFAEMEALQKKYGHLQELNEIFKESSLARKKFLEQWHQMEEAA